MPQTSNLSVVLDYMEHIARRDVEGALSLAAPNVVFRGPDGSELDKDGLRGLFAMLGGMLVNPMRQEIVGTTCEGDRVAIEATMTTLLANGKTYSNRYHFLFQLENGRIVRSNEYCDTRAIDAFA